MASGGSSGVSDATVFVSLALFIVWMKRQKVTNLDGSPSRWGAFFGALSGKYTISSNVSPAAATSPSDSGAAATTSSTAGTSKAPGIQADIPKSFGGTAN